MDCKILFTEPYTYDGLHCHHQVFRVTRLFRDQLVTPTEVLSDKKSNAYIFGPEFPLGSYRRVSQHDNDGGQTGFTACDTVLSIYKDSWDSAECLESVRKAIPHILFIGQTVLGLNFTFTPKKTLTRSIVL